MLRSLIAATAMSVALSALADDLAAVRQAAGEHFADARWEDAVTAYSELTAAEPGNGRAWFRQGVALRELGRANEALAALEKAEEAGVPAGFVRYETARVQMAMGRESEAVATLEEAVEAGFGRFESLDADVEWQRSRGTPRFDALRARAYASRYPCEHDDAFRAFDFWVGEWEVSTAAGQAAGTNRITREQHGCVLREEWSSVTGVHGTSINYYDRGREKWVQLWIDESGGIIDIAGALENGSMVLTGDIFDPATATRAPFRGTWTPLPDGRVRQFFEQSADDGQTWTPWFDGYYVRAGAGAD